MDKKMFFTLAGVILLNAVVLSSAVFGGTGSCDASASPAVVDISVYFSYPETEDNLKNEWKAHFQELSDRLWTATGQQLRLRKVTAYIRDEGRRPGADVIVGKRDSTAKTANSDMGSLGGTGRIFIDHIFGLPQSTDPRSAGLIFVHEWGHYQFNLGDEYCGQWVSNKKANTWGWLDLKGGGPAGIGWGIYNNCQIVPETQCGKGQNDNWSIMSGPRAVSGVTGGWPLGFCDSTWHNAGTQDSRGRLWLTHQQYQWNLADGDHTSKDCWTIMQRLQDTTSSKNLVFSLFVPPYPTQLTAAPAIEWKVFPTMSRTMLCIDRSGSMGWEYGKMEYAKLAASMFVAATGPRRLIDIGNFFDPADDLYQEADWVGVVDFDDLVTTTYPLSEVDGWVLGTKLNAIAAISGLYDRGATAIGDGLERCRSEHLRVDNPSVGGPASGRIIVLLSDGQDNSSSIAPLTAATNCSNADVRIYTIGLGSDVDRQLMANIASIGGGRYLFVGSARDLFMVYLDFLGEFKGGLRSNTTHTLPGGTSLKRTISIDQMSDTTEFLLASESSDLTFSVTSPLGVEYLDSNSQANVTFVDCDETKFFRIVDPKPGKWTVVVKAPDGFSDYDFQLATFSSSPLLDVKPTLSKSEYTYGQDLPLLTCLVSNGPPVGGVSVSVDIIGPDGITETVALCDDGSEIHGDKEAEDGIYSNYYAGINRNGTYTAKFRIVNKNGYTVGHGIEGLESESEPVPPFEREQSASFNVTGAPSVITEWLRVDMLKATLNYKKLGKDTITLQGEFNTLEKNVSFLSTGATFKNEVEFEDGQTGSYTATLLPYKFKAGRGSKYTYKDKVTGLSGAFLLGSGGSTRCRYALQATNQNIAGVMPSTEADVENLLVTMKSGSFDETVGIIPTTTSNGCTFRLPQNFYSTPCMLVDSLIIQRSVKQVNKDNLRATIRIEAEKPFDANSNTLALSIDKKELQIGPKDWTKKDKKNQNLLYMKKNGKEKVTLQLNTVKRQISLTWANTDLSTGVISNTPLIHVGYTGFDKSNILGLSVKSSASNETLWY